MLPFGAENIQEFVEKWNRAIPIDRWYRQKYNIAFGSAAHKAVNLADMYCDFYEFIYMKFKYKKNKKDEQEPYVRGQGNFIKSVIYSKQDIDKIFDELNIDEIE